MNEGNVSRGRMLAKFELFMYDHEDDFGKGCFYDEMMTRFWTQHKEDLNACGFASVSEAVEWMKSIKGRGFVSEQR